MEPFALCRKTSKAEAQSNLSNPKAPAAKAAAQSPWTRQKDTPHIAAETINKGKLLSSLAADAVRSICAWKPRLRSGRHSYATLCSGTETLGVCIHTFENQLFECGFDQQFACQFMCEKNARKQTWLLKQASSLMSDECCFFPDATKLSEG